MIPRGRGETGGHRDPLDDFKIYKEQLAPSARGTGLAMRVTRCSRRISLAQGRRGRISRLLLSRMRRPHGTCREFRGYTACAVREVLMRKDHLRHGVRLQHVPWTCGSAGARVFIGRGRSVTTNEEDGVARFAPSRPRW